MKSGSYENNFKSDFDTVRDRIHGGLCSFLTYCVQKVMPALNLIRV